MINNSIESVLELNALYPKINLRVAFKSPAQLGDHFPFQDQVIDPNKQSNVVYHVKCMDCDDDYIGKTTQILNERIHDHTTKIHTYTNTCNPKSIELT